MAVDSLPFKDQAHALIDKLPDTATWDDLVYQAELRCSIEHGLADSQANRVIAVDDLLKEFGIEE